MKRTERQGGVGNKLLAVGLGFVAAKLALVVIEQIWTKGLRRPLPDADEASTANKVAWMGVTAAAVGMARELAKELAAPLREDDSEE